MFDKLSLGFALAHDQLEGMGDVLDLDPLFVYTKADAEFLAGVQEVSIEDELKRAISWAIETIGRKPEDLYVFPLGKMLRIETKKIIEVKEKSRLEITLKDD
jgi:hypothetical protein